MMYFHISEQISNRFDIMCKKRTEEEARGFSFKNGLYFKLQNVIRQETLALQVYCPFPTSFFTTRLSNV